MPGTRTSKPRAVMVDCYSNDVMKIYQRITGCINLINYATDSVVSYEDCSMKEEKLLEMGNIMVYNPFDC